MVALRLRTGTSRAGRDPIPVAAGASKTNTERLAGLLPTSAVGADGVAGAETRATLLPTLNVMIRGSLRHHIHLWFHHINGRMLLLLLSKYYRRGVQN